MQVPLSNYPRPGLTTDREQLRTVAKFQRNLIICVLLQIGVGVINGVNGSHVLALALFEAVLAVVMLVLSLISVYNLAKALGEPAWLYVVLMFIPCVSLFALISIIVKATNKLKENGIKVGLIGADPNSI